MKYFIYFEFNEYQKRIKFLGQIIEIGDYYIVNYYKNKFSK